MCSDLVSSHAVAAAKRARVETSLASRCALSEPVSRPMLASSQPKGFSTGSQKTPESTAATGGGPLPIAAETSTMDSTKISAPAGGIRPPSSSMA